jgi:hypothetical protein
VVTLSASPDAHCEFEAWSGHSDCLDGVVTMSTDKSCTADFVLARYTLSVGRNGLGSGTVTSSPAGINCGATCSADFDYLTSVQLTPNPATGSTFAGWSGDADCSDGIVSMSGDISCTAQFNLARYALSVIMTGSGTGVVTSSPAGINCGSTCSADFDYLTSVQLTPSPDAGSAFTGWDGDADCSDGEVSMVENLSCTAEFSPALIFEDGFESGSTVGWSSTLGD